MLESRHCQAERSQLQLSPRPFPKRWREAGSLEFRQGIHQLAGEEEMQAPGPNFSILVSHSHPREKLSEPHGPNCSSSSNFSIFAKCCIQHISEGRVPTLRLGSLPWPPAPAFETEARKAVVLTTLPLSYGHYRQITWMSDPALPLASGRFPHPQFPHL